MDRPTLRGWWQDEDGAWHPPDEKPAPEPVEEPRAPTDGAVAADDTVADVPDTTWAPDASADGTVEEAPAAEPEIADAAKPEVAEPAEPAEADAVRDAVAGPAGIEDGPAESESDGVAAEPEPEAEPETAVAPTALVGAVRPGMAHRPGAPPPTSQLAGVEARVHGVTETVVEEEVHDIPPKLVATRTLSVVRPAPPHRPPPPPVTGRWQTGHLVAAALAGLLIGAFIGAALKDDSPARPITSVTSTSVVTPTTASNSGVPGLFDSSGGQSSQFGGQSPAQGGPNITTPNPFGGVPTSASPTSLPFTPTPGLGQTPTSLAPGVTGTAPIVPLTSMVGDGTYRVGVDIQPGTYRSPGPSTPGIPCIWERQAVFGDSSTAIDANAETDQAIVSILSTDRGFKTTRCQRWDKVG